ncbi:MAG: hypothetical protein WBQ23_04880 [Bacteroidota bacterium]
MAKTIVFCIVVLLLQIYTASGQSDEDMSPNPEITADPAITIEDDYPWEWRVFAATGYGYPQGSRSEIGYNFGRYFFAGLNIGIGDYWSSNPGEATFGLIAGIHWPIPEFPITPYLLFGTGGILTLFGQSDYYRLINAGAMIPLIGRLTLRPELSICFTSKYISGGGLSLYSPAEIEIREKTTRVGMNVLVEFAF